MEEINQRVLEVSRFVEDCYNAQTRAFSPWEYHFIRDLLTKNDLKTVLDIGTGNGTFLHGLAKLTPGVVYEAIDADPSLILHAKRHHSLKNITYDARLFDHSYPARRFDLISARFSVEHMEDVSHFITETCRRLTRKGFLLVTEYYVDPMNSDNPLWRAFREREYEFYIRFGSHPRISLVLPELMKEAGYSQVESIYRHIAPSTVGVAPFYDLIVTYANLYHNIEPAIFDVEFRDKLVAYCRNAPSGGHGVEDGLFVSHTLAGKHDNPAG
jgi:ubiquinone/menaquinone biosynthesis C-methylase UbiE